MILVVDDQLYNLEAIESILMYSCKLDVEEYCVFSQSGEDAIKIIENNLKKNGNQFIDYELILMDIMMPVLDGYETTRAIRKHLETNQVQQPTIVSISGNTEQSF